MVDLNSLLPADSVWTLVQANAINDNGWITGRGTFNGQSHGFYSAPERCAGTVRACRAGHRGDSAGRGAMAISEVKRKTE